MDIKLAYLQWAQNVLAILFNCLRNWKASLCDFSKTKEKRGKKKAQCEFEHVGPTLWVGFTTYLRWTKDKEIVYFDPPSMPIIFLVSSFCKLLILLNPPQTLTSHRSYTSLNSHLLQANFHDYCTHSNMWDKSWI